MSAPTAPLEQLLVAQGIRITSARRQVLSQILAQPASFTAQGLCQQVRRRHRHVSRATVYRMIKLMQDAGVLKAIHTGPGALSYIQQAARQVPVAELVCTDCHRVEVIEAPFMQWYAQAAAQKVGLTALEGRLQVQGECQRLKKGQCPHARSHL